METGVAFGAGKSGGAFDPISFISRPQVILRILCWLFSVITFGCVNNAWLGEEKPTCVFNNDGNACRFGNIISLVGFLGALSLLVLEGLFQSLSSIKVRKRAVIVDLAFSAAWAVLYLIVSAYLAISWSKSDHPLFGQGINNARAAVAFSILSIPVWGGCAYFAWMRWQSGTDMGQFASAYETGAYGPPGTAVPGAEASWGTATDPSMAPPVDPSTYAGDANAYANATGNNPFGAANAYQAPAY